MQGNPFDRFRQILLAELKMTMKQNFTHSSADKSFPFSLENTSVPEIDTGIISETGVLKNRPVLYRLRILSQAAESVRPLCGIPCRIQLPPKRGEK